MTSLVVYNPEAIRLILKINEVFTGVFDTSVPAYPLVGILFLSIFVTLRRAELAQQMSKWNRSIPQRVIGALLVVLPGLAVLAFGPALVDSYAFSGAALVTCWVGTLIVLKPSLLSFLIPYLAIYVTAVGAVDYLTGLVGNFLAEVVATTSSGMSYLFRVPVSWSANSISFLPQGGQPVFLYVSQECSGVASISIFLLLMVLMHLDAKPKLFTSAIFGIIGTLLFIFLNALRVISVILGGIFGGVSLMWSLHGWIGYVFYMIGYSAIVLTYLKAAGSSIFFTNHNMNNSPGEA